MKSMTGYGKATATLNGCELTVELKSVNHRFLDLNSKIPRSFNAYEDLIRSILSQNLSRGHIDVFVKYLPNSEDEKSVAVDLGLAKGYLSAVNSLCSQLDLKNDFQLSSLVKTPDIIRIEQREEDVDSLRQILRQALTDAVNQLNTMRQNEGRLILADIENRLNNIENLLNSVKELAPTVAKDYAEKLTARISEALKAVEIDQNRLLNEVAFFVDKSNVDEEISRLDSHIKNCREILQMTEPQGRKLDFLVQEFNREANTICSKSNNVTLTNLALELKNEIEKVREQVQNIE